MRLKFSLKSTWRHSIKMKRLKAPTWSDSEQKNSFLQRCFRCFISVTRIVIEEWASSYYPPSETCHFSHTSKPWHWTASFLPCLSSNSLEMNNGDFQQMLLPQPWQSETDSAPPLMLWPTQLKTAFCSAEIMAFPPLSSTLRHLHPGISSDIKQFSILTPWPESTSQ